METLENNPRTVNSEEDLFGDETKDIFCDKEDLFHTFNPPTKKHTTESNK